MRDRGQQRYSTYRDLACALAASVGVQVFHPFDTILRRIQVNKGRIDSIESLRKAVFAESLHGNTYARVISVYQGFYLAGLYKFLSCTYRFCGQFYFERHVHEIYGADIRLFFGDTYPTALISASVGGSQGLAEVLMLYPLETLKVKLQCGDPRPLIPMFKAEWPMLYNGCGAAIARCVPSNFVLFGVHGAILARYGSDNSEKSFQQYAVASLGATCATMVVTNPMDVIKTRVQAFKGEIGSLSMFKKTIVEEGWRALTKGMTLKVLTAGPRVMLSLLLAHYLPQMIENENSRSVKPK